MYTGVNVHRAEYGCVTVAEIAGGCAFFAEMVSQKICCEVLVAKWTSDVLRVFCAHSARSPLSGMDVLVLAVVGLFFTAGFAVDLCTDVMIFLIKF